MLATNTSSLSVTEMARELRRPERVVGLHFFNPVALLPLVEVVATPFTDDVTLATAWDVTRKLRKTGVLVKDAPAFVVNRLLARPRLGRHRRARPWQHRRGDGRGRCSRLGLPMAPSVLTAMVGPRVANHVRHTLHDAFPRPLPLSATLESLADGGDVVVVEERRRTVEEIHEEVLEALADEIRHLLDDGVVASPKDIDTCLLLGAGYPFFLGGITPHLDTTGVSERVLGTTFARVRATG